VRRKEGERTMMMGEEHETGGPEEVETGGPGEVFDDYNIHGIAHWNSHAWDRAAAQAAHRFPRARPNYVRVVPALKSAAAYFSSLHLSAWDHAGNEARLHKVKDAVWINKRAEELARAAYHGSGGDDSGFVIEFERHYGRPPTDRESIRAAVRALVYIATAKTHPGYRQRLAKVMGREPVTLTQAALQVAVTAQGLVPADAYPVPPHCAECSERRKHGMPRVVEPDEINLSIVYSPTNTNTNTNTVASGAGAVATTQTNTASDSSSISAPTTVTPAAPPAAPPPPPPPPSVAWPWPVAPAVPVAPQVVVPMPPPVPYFAPPAAPAPPVAAVVTSPSAPPASSVFNGMFGGNPYAAAAAILAGPTLPSGPASVVGASGAGAATAINNSGNVNLTLVGEDGAAGEVLGGGGEDDGSGAAGFDPSQMGDMEVLAGMMAGGGGGVLDALGLTTGGPSEEDDGIYTGGPDDDDDDDGLLTGGPDDDDGIFTGGPDDEGGIFTSGPDDEGGILTGGFVGGTGWEEEEDGEEGPPLHLFGGAEEGIVGSLLDGEGGGDAGLAGFLEPAPCSTGTCELS
jgi:hypothetical protein